MTAIRSTEEVADADIHEMGNANMTADPVPAVERKSRKVVAVHGIGEMKKMKPRKGKARSMKTRSMKPNRRKKQPNGMVVMKIPIPLLSPNRNQKTTL